MPYMIPRATGKRQNTVFSLDHSKRGANTQRKDRGGEKWSDRGGEKTKTESNFFLDGKRITSNCSKIEQEGPRHI